MTVDRRCTIAASGRSMIDLSLPPADSVRQAIAQNGYVFVPGTRMRELLAALGPLTDWDRFAASWNDLALDTYMADGGRYRRRRHAVYAALPDGTVVRAPHQPHYQGREYNPLNGGIARWFEPIDWSLGSGPTMAAILRFCQAVFGSLAPDVSRWHVEAHQFRIEARPGEASSPTPEGVHRDGVDYVLVLLVARRNVTSGTTTIHDVDRRLFGSFTLTQPFEAVLLDDLRVAHGVTPIEPIDPSKPACRDVLVVTWKQARPA
jgi:hypothetical protein